MNELFVLVGNGTYENRGCEAIIRGTLEIIRKYYESPRFVVCSHFRDQEHFRRQLQMEKDSGIIHLPVRFLPGTKNPFFGKFFRRLFGYFPEFRARYMYANILQHIDDSEAVLSIGGDNYSLDYGIPQCFTDLDDLVKSRGKRLVIWGASVGPFGRLPAYERYMSGHLPQQAGIFARESMSISYLRKLGVEQNVFRVADPAFVLPPRKPVDSYLFADLDKTIGVNLSPLMARYVTNGDMDAWIKICAGIVKELWISFGSPILLVPHVFESGNNDYVFLSRVKEESLVSGVRLLAPRYDASEIKWLISRLLVFLGSRTHATIAAFSSCVPTVSLAYSMKAEGLNLDIFGSLTNCLKPGQINPGNVRAAVAKAIEDNQKIRGRLKERLSDIIIDSYQGGSILKTICSRPRTNRLAGLKRSASTDSL